ncbi:MAG: MarR family transcriptional regulator [bacterium]|nr:MAG: MarR family transcriptional regulator [bacterium]
MQIEKEIKQKSFKNEYHKLTVNLMFTGSWLNVKNHDFLKPYGITIQQYNILRILRGQHPNPTTVSLLIDRMLDKMSNVSRLVEKLRIKGLVNRRECEKDRRAVDVLITDNGLALLKEIEKHEQGWEESFHTLTPQEAQQLNKLLDKLRG